MKTKLYIVIIVTLTLVQLILCRDAAASDWFVRPAGGNYGTEDGTSYENAWDGLLSVVWGSGGVEAGDTLYICGLHVHEVTNRGYIATQADITPVSGTSESAKVTIRGDYPGNQGIVWGAYRMSYDTWTDEGDGVWSNPLPGNSYGDWYFQDIGNPTNEDFVVLDKENDIEGVRNHPGSHYSVDYETNSLLYVKLTDGGNPTGRIYANRWGYDWQIGGLQYITFLNLKFYNPYRFLWGESANHIRWEGCTLTYGEHSLISLFDNSDYMEVINCELSWAGNGIYIISNTNNAASHYLFKGNYIHDIGVRESTQNGDAHCIGIQGGHDGVIEGNICENCGSGPLLYAFTNQELKNTIVRRNLIKDLHNLGGATGYGISTQCNNDASADKSGNKFYQNIVINASVGGRFHYEQEQEVYNNIFYNCKIGFASYRNYNGLGANVKLKNNIFLNSTSYHIHWGSGASSYTLDSDYNLFYPTDGNLFCHNVAGGEMTFTEWQAHSVPGCTFDPNSIAADPLFVDPENTNFRLQAGSPAIDAGVDVGLTQDYEGNTIPQDGDNNGSAEPDIGAYESPYTATLEGLISYWKFDGNANDETGVNNGTVVGAQFSPNGQQGQTLEFDGDLDYVDFGNDNSLNMGTNNFSISFWFKKRWADDVYTSILYKATPRQVSPGYGFLLRETGGDLKFTIGDGGTIAQAVGPGIRDTEWHHAVGVRGGGTIKLYLDNVLRAEADDTVGSVDSNENFVMGMGGYGNNPGGPYAGCYFRGKIDELKIFDRALTASEINQMYQNDIANHTEPPSVILNSPANGETNVLTSPVLDVTVTDIDEDTMDVSFYGSSTNASLDNFTIIVLPDTQMYVDPGTYSHIFTNQIQWIVDNKDTLNIVFVTHVGDIVNNWNSIQEWEYANESMSLLDGVVPWGVLPGNHDQEFPSSFPHNAYYYNQYFNYTRFEQYSWYGGHYGDNNDNNYQLFSAGGMDFIIIHLEYNPSDEVLNWANQLLSTYSDRRAIVNSHYIVRYHGGWSTIGEKIFNALKDNPNLFLMLCGHDPNGAGRRTDIVNNNTIHSLMTDYQTRPNGGNGWLKMITFSPKDNKICVKTHSPYLDSYRVYTSERFVLGYPMTDYIEIGTNSGVTNGSSSIVTWPGLADNTKYYWYVSAVDNNFQTSESEVWSFITTSGDTTGNQPPDISAIPGLLTKNEGETITAAEIELAQDPDGDTLTYTYSGWLSSLPYDITYDDAGTHTLHVNVSDGTDTVGKDITITVALVANEWFVRPAGGNYGSEDGSSYQDAWDGLLNVVWGPGGVEAGDTLYVCGVDIYPQTPLTFNNIKVDITASGNDEDSRIIIRGDYPGDPGTIWGNHIVGGPWSEWTYEGDNTYSVESNNTRGYFYFENITGTWDLLTKVNSLQECKDTPGSYYSSTFKNPDPVYFHCSDNGHPNLRVSSPTVGYNIYLSGQQYITFLNIDFYSPMFQDIGSYIRWEGCKLWYVPNGLCLWDNTHHLEFIDCDRAYGVGGFSFQDRPPRGEDAPHDMTIRGCYIHDIGIYVKNVDAEGIGTNGVDDLTIENNEFYNCGSAFTSYPYSGSTNKNTIIRWNYIHHMHTNLGRGRGIEVNMDPLNTQDRSGCQVYGNIVANIPDVAYRSTFSTYLVEFYNNVAYNCDIAFYFNYVYSAELGSNIKLRNNISMNPANAHIYYGTQTTEGNYVIDSDYNLFYPDGAEFFQFKELSWTENDNLSEWQALSRSGCTFDPHSIVADPLFVDPENGNFHLRPNSPAIDAGVDVGLTRDFEGIPVPQGNAPDIGAYEYVLLPVSVIKNEPKEGRAPLTVSFDGSQSTSPNGDIVSYQWDFGDGSTSTGIKTSHIFTSPGEYTVTLRVTDDLGLKGESQTHIIVLKKEFGELPAGCYNNVFNPAKGERALIVVELSNQAHVKLNLYNTRGNKIKELADEEKEAGSHKYYWDGKSGNGDVVGSGLYFVHIQAGDYRKTKKIVVVK